METEGHVIKNLPMRSISGHQGCLTQHRASRAVIGGQEHLDLDTPEPLAHGWADQRALPAV